VILPREAVGQHAIDRVLGRSCARSGGGTGAGGV